jgi:hypothetical protein
MLQLVYVFGCLVAVSFVIFSKSRVPVCTDRWKAFPQTMKGDKRLDGPKLAGHRTIAFLLSDHSLQHASRARGYDLIVNF